MQIVKERQMEFDVETDPDTLVELFGDDAYSFSESVKHMFIETMTWSNLQLQRSCLGIRP
jgi:hypothetical protein